MVSKIFRLPAFVGICLVAIMVPVYAGVFQSSADGEGGQGYYIAASISLPQYSGPGTITSVSLAFNGVATGNQEGRYDYNPRTGISSDTIDSIGFIVLGPSPAKTALEGSAQFDFKPYDFPPCATCVDEDFRGAVGTADFSVPVSGTAYLTDLSAFGGSGNNNFKLFANPMGDQLSDAVSGTLTETITFTAPEPSTWALLLLGFAGLGLYGLPESEAAARHVKGRLLRPASSQLCHPVFPRRR